MEQFQEKEAQEEGVSHKSEQTRCMQADRIYAEGFNHAHQLAILHEEGQDKISNIIVIL